MEAHVRRGDLLAGVNKVLFASAIAHEELLEISGLFWDAVLPLNAEDFLNSIDLIFYAEEQSLIVAFMSKDKAQEMVNLWNERANF
jgi:hypothetical protein